MEKDQKTAILNNINMVKERIRSAAEKVGRKPEEIELVAVTKKKNAMVVKTLAENGVQNIGESYLQEAAFKIDLLKDLQIEWHMIGPVQSGKEKNIADKFSVVHSVDRIEVARKLNSAADKYGRILPVYLEFNVSGEATKHGWNAWDKVQWKAILDELAEIDEFNSLKPLGLMTMAPYDSNPEAARPYFRKLKELRDFLNERMPGSGLVGLSMGMSVDFEVAIEEGATIVRIGSALVGPR